MARSFGEIGISHSQAPWAAQQRMLRAHLCGRLDASARYSPAAAMRPLIYPAAVRLLQEARSRESDR